MTPWQSSALLDAEGDRQRDRFDLALFAAWHVEGFARTKRLPDLARLLERKPARSTTDDMPQRVKDYLAKRKATTEKA